MGTINTNVYKSLKMLHIRRLASKGHADDVEARERRLQPVRSRLVYFRVVERQAHKALRSIW